MNSGPVRNQPAHARLFEKLLGRLGFRVPVIDRLDDGIRVEGEVRGLVFFFGKGIQQVFLVGKNNAVRVLAHLRHGKKTADGGHAVNVGDVNGLVVAKKSRAFRGQSFVGLFAGRHVEGDDDMAGAVSELIILIMLVFGRQFGEGVPDFEWFGAGENEARAGQHQGEQHPSRAINVEHKSMTMPHRHEDKLNGG